MQNLPLDIEVVNCICWLTITYVLSLMKSTGVLANLDNFYFSGLMFWNILHLLYILYVYNVCYVICIILCMYVCVLHLNCVVAVRLPHGLQQFFNTSLLFVKLLSFWNQSWVNSWNLWVPEVACRFKEYCCRPLKQCLSLCNICSTVARGTFDGCGVGKCG